MSSSLSEDASGVINMDTLGVSVYHLKQVFWEERVLRQAGFTRDATIYDLEEPVIRHHGRDDVCPLDGRAGAAYVHCLEGDDHVGQATHMLSYSWG